MAGDEMTQRRLIGRESRPAEPAEPAEPVVQDPAHLHEGPPISSGRRQKILFFLSKGK